MPKIGRPASNRPAGAGSAPGEYTEAGPPDRMIAAGFLSRMAASGVVAGMISEYTWHSRTRRAMSCAYCAPKSITSTGPGDSIAGTASAYLAGLAGARLGDRGRGA